MCFVHLSALTKPAGRLVSRNRRNADPSLTQETADMLLDNLYSMMGATGTASILFGILALVGVPAWATVMCPKSAYTRLQRSR